MRWTEVTSSNLQLIGVDGKDLLVQFHSGAQYRYLGAGGQFRLMLSEADAGHSVGQYFNRNVKGAYPYEKVGP